MSSVITPHARTQNSGQRHKEHQTVVAEVHVLPSSTQPQPHVQDPPYQPLQQNDARLHEQRDVPTLALSFLNDPASFAGSDANRLHGVLSDSPKLGKENERATHFSFVQFIMQQHPDVKVLFQRALSNDNCDPAALSVTEHAHPLLKLFPGDIAFTEYPIRTHPLFHPANLPNERAREPDGDLFKWAERHSYVRCFLGGALPTQTGAKTLKIQVVFLLLLCPGVALADIADVTFNKSQGDTASCLVFFKTIAAARAAEAVLRFMVIDDTGVFVATTELGRLVMLVYLAVCQMSWREQLAAVLVETDCSLESRTRRAMCFRIERVASAVSAASAAAAASVVLPLAQHLAATFGTNTNTNSNVPLWAMIPVHSNCADMKTTFFDQRCVPHSLMSLSLLTDARFRCCYALVAVLKWLVEERRRR